jgi:hypothetical protein
LSESAGNCVDPKQPLSIQQFEKLFPSVSLSLFEKEPAFEIAIRNGSVLSTKPEITRFCRFIETIESHSDFAGLVLMGLSILAIRQWHVLSQRKRVEAARELAKQAHKILATSNRRIYMYDLKVQLRARHSGIDSLWKLVVKFIEEDSHVLVRIPGARNAVYWQWVGEPAGN